MHGGPRRYDGGCHKEKMLQEHLNSSGFQVAFPKAWPDQYRQSLHFPVIDNEKPTQKEMLSMDSKIPFLGSRKEMDEIIEAVQKVARNIDKVA